MISFRRIYGRQDTVYLTRITIGERLRIHYFHRPDEDPDPHDHALGFWTFPLKSYVEEVHREDYPPLHQIVPAFKWSYREATHRHRVVTAPTLTITWRDKGEPREWFFYRKGLPIPWRQYLDEKPTPKP